MADDEKTEEPTSKKLEDARNEGNVGKSMEVVGAAVLTLGSIYLIFFSDHLFFEIKNTMKYIYGFMTEELTSATYFTITYAVSMTLMKALMPIFLFIFTIRFIIIIFAIIDFYFSKHYYIKSLRMSKQEIKDEYKNMEGDPQVKGRIRRIQMQMAQKRMMSSVPEADVVITNPTHYAVALKYDSSKNQAPIVIAKGIDFLALRIKEVAKENSITIVENPALARALYDQIDLDREVPNEFYKAVAEIFTYIYDLKKRR